MIRMTEKLRVTFEGESYTDADDKSVEFNLSAQSIPLQDDFMTKMFEYLESDHPYKILYQIKSIHDNKNSEVDSKPYVAIIGSYNQEKGGKKGGVLIKEIDEVLSAVGSWNVSDSKTFTTDLYSNPTLFELVVVTISESMAPTD